MATKSEELANQINLATEAKVPVDQLSMAILLGLHEQLERIANALERAYPPVLHAPMSEAEIVAMMARLSDPPE